MSSGLASPPSKELGLAALLLVLAAVVYHPLLAPGTTPYSRHSDFVAQHLAMKEVAFRSLQDGHGLPLWKSDLLSGGPALTHPQALYTNPFQLLFLWLEPTAAAGPTLFIHILTLGLGMFVLGGALGLGRGPRLVLGAAGLLSYKLVLIVYAAWLPVLPAFSLLPLLLAAVLHWLDRPSAGSALGLALVGLLALHGGHLQLVYYALMLLGPYALAVLVGRTRRGERRAARTAWLGGLAAVGLAVAGSAYLLVPLAAESGLTTRTEAGYGFFLARPDFSARHLATFLQPELLGTPLDDSYPWTELWEDVAYFGAAAELLAIVGMVLGRRRRHVRFLTIAFALSIFLAVPSPVTRLLFEALPGYALFRSPGRFLFVTTVLGIALAGVGLQELLARTAPRLRAVAVGGVLLAVVAEGAYHARRYVDSVPREVVLPASDLPAVAAADPVPHRVAPVQRSTFNYGWAAPYGLQLVTGFDAYNFRHYQDYLSVLQWGRVRRRPAPVWTDVVGVTRLDLMDALDVGYLVTPAAIEAPPAGYERIATLRAAPRFVFYRGLGEGDLFVYRNPGAGGRARFAHHVTSARDGEDALARLLEVDLRETTLVEWSTAEVFQGPLHASGTLRVAEARGGFLALETQTDGLRFLVVSEVWHPGWRATVDGQPARLLRTDVTLMGLWVPPGDHRIELSFRPLHWTAALATSALGLSGLAAWAAALARRRLRGPQASLQQSGPDE